jgi:hypothetical protein
LHRRHRRRGEQREAEDGTDSRGCAQSHRRRGGWPAAPGSIGAGGGVLRARRHDRPAPAQTATALRRQVSLRSTSTAQVGGAERGIGRHRFRRQPAGT